MVLGIGLLFVLCTTSFSGLVAGVVYLILACSDSP